MKEGENILKEAINPMQIQQILRGISETSINVGDITQIKSG